MDEKSQIAEDCSDERMKRTSQRRNWRAPAWNLAAQLAAGPAAFLGKLETCRRLAMLCPRGGRQALSCCHDQLDYYTTTIGVSIQARFIIYCGFDSAKAGLTYLVIYLL